MKFVIATFILLFTLTSNSQTTPEDKIGAWYIINGTHKVTEKLSFKTGFQLRSFEVLDNINLLFYSTGANYQLNKNTTLTFGYSYLDIDRTFIVTGENHLYENRPYEQINYKLNLFNLPINNRLRLEHRFLNFKHNHQTLHRFRYLIGTNLKLSDELFLVVNEEIFFNTKGQVFTENRFSANFNLNISKTNYIKIGYINQIINKLNLNRLQLGLFFKTDFTKK